ncbi:MAG: hypothetical protein RTV72_05420 [Candidatus Thorarchaeota archaeon]
MRINRSNIHVILIISLMVFTGLLIPVISDDLIKDPTPIATLKGEPIIDTIFQDLVSQVPDAVMFPQYPIIETETSITMNSDYRNLDFVNESLASSKALEFISHVWYLSECNFSKEISWTNLYDGNWNFKFISSNISVYIGINAISGKVNDFVSSWEDENSPFILNTNEDNFANTTEIEQLAFDFLERFNYTLSSDAQYVGPTLIEHKVFHHDVFHISFFHVVNGTYIEHSAVHLDIDVEARAVLAFSYWWVNINALPIENIITTDRARDVAIDYLTGLMNVSEFDVQSTSLIFDRTWTPTGQEYRLSWKVFIESEYIGYIIINAKSGSIYGTGIKGIESESVFSELNPTISRPPYSLVLLLFFGSSLVAVIVLLMTRRRIFSLFSNSLVRIAHSVQGSHS